MIKNFSPKSPTEKAILTFDFTKMLVTSETIQGLPTITSVVVRGGVDPSSQGMISGNPTVTGPKVSQLVINGKLNLTYCIKCRIVTSLGQELELAGHLEILDC